MDSAPRPPFWSLCRAEPFRIFFPLATLLGVSGVSLWPLYFSGMHKFYPGLMHARLMIEGFLAGFVIGFLGTALPRLLDAPALRRGELWALLTLYLLTAGLHIGEQPSLGDLAFIALLLFFGACMIPRLGRGTERPPPSFVLVVLGYLSGLLGPILWLCGLRGWASGPVTLLGSMLLHEAFGIFLVLGVGAFLLPRFLGTAEEAIAPQEWWVRAGLALLTGAILLAGYWKEANDPLAPAATWLRGLAVVFYLATMIPIRRGRTPRRTTVSVAARLSLFALTAGLAFPLLWPGQRLAGLHIVFLGGFSLIIFTVATRVVLGHTGHEALLDKPLPTLQIATLLLVVGAGLRAIGDFLPTRPHWLSGASYLWMLAAGVWGWSVLRKVRGAPCGEF